MSLCLFHSIIRLRIVIIESLMKPINLIFRTMPTINMVMISIISLTNYSHIKGQSITHLIQIIQIRISTIHKIIWFGLIILKSLRIINKAFILNLYSTNSYNRTRLMPIIKLRRRLLTQTAQLNLVNQMYTSVVQRLQEKINNVMHLKPDRCFIKMMVGRSKKIKYF